MLIEQKNKGVIFLSGGGSENQTKELDLEFSKYIDGKKLMYIPIAINRDAIGFQACYDWITRALLSFEYKKDVPVIDMFLDPDLIKKEIHKYDALYIGGGNTYKLLDFIYKNKLERDILDFYTSGKVIYGGSAGAIILGKDIRTVLEENDANYTNTLGLNLVNDFLSDVIIRVPKRI